MGNNSEISGLGVGATGTFYGVKGKHLLPSDYIWQAYVPNTEALVIFKPLQNNPPLLVIFITAPTFLDFIGRQQSSREDKGIKLEEKRDGVTAAFLGLRLIQTWARSERSKID